MVDCMECTNFKKCHYSGQLTGRLTSCPDFKQKPKTNADRIRAMSDEELAEWALYKAREIGREYSHSLLGLIQWLKQPAEK